MCDVAESVSDHILEGGGLWRKESLMFNKLVMYFLYNISKIDVPTTVNTKVTV